MSAPTKKPRLSASAAKEPTPAPPAADAGGLRKRSFDYSPGEIDALNQHALIYPWRLFNLTELTVMIGISDSVMTKISAYSAEHGDRPVPMYRRARPEAISAFLQNPPPDFSTK